MVFHVYNINIESNIRYSWNVDHEWFNREVTFNFNFKIEKKNLMQYEALYAVSQFKMEQVCVEILPFDNLTCCFNTCPYSMILQRTLYIVAILPSHVDTQLTSCMWLCKCIS